MLDFNNLPSYKGSRKFIKKYYELYNNPIVFITARDTRAVDCSRAWIECNLPGIKYELCFAGYSKYKTCLEKNINYMIEDHDDTAIQLANNGIVTFLPKRIWNKKIEYHENIVKFNSWSELFPLLRRSNA